MIPTQRRPSFGTVCVFALAVAAVPAAIHLRTGPPDAASSPAPSARQIAAEDPLVGLWSAHPPGGQGQPVQLYYFHGDGHGLYRYGRVGATNTNSFDYTVGDGVVTLVFRKTGGRHPVQFSIDADGEERRLVLEQDPRAGGRQRYVQVRSEPASPHEAPTGAGSESCGGSPVAGRLWLDRTAFATGGYGFGLYQLRCGGIDGRGTGWFHRGDFDDWTTEALNYRVAGGRIELQFAATTGVETTEFTVTPGEQRTLSLASDPRDFWHPHRYVDAGPSFGWITSVAAPAGELNATVAVVTDSRP